MSEITFTAKAKQEFDQILEKYKEKESAVLSVLYLAQREFKELSPPVIEYVARLLDLTPAHVHGVATFYTMFHTKKVGRYVICLCRTLSCELRGALEILEHLERKLGIKDGETTTDGKFSIMTVECLGYCGTAPVVQINDKTYENVTPDAVDRILGELS